MSDVVSKGTFFLWQLLLARWLGDAGYGIYGTIGALIVVGGSIVDFGMGLIVVREVSKRPRDAGRFLAATLAIQPLLAVAGYVGLGLAARLLGYDAELRSLLSLAAASLLINAVGNICHNQLIAAERMDLPAAISVVHVLSLVGLAATALWMGAGLWGLYIATLAAGALRSGLYWFALSWTGRAAVGPLDRPTVRELFQSGLPLAVMAFLTLSCMHIDKVLTVALVGKEPAGHLAAAAVIPFGIVQLLNTTILVAILPVMSRLAKETGQVLSRLIAVLSLLTVALGLPAAVLISGMATTLCAWLFGAEFLPAGKALRILIWYTSLAMLVNIYSQGLIVQNRQSRLMVIRTAGLFVAVMLNLALLPRLGIVGAATASLVSEAVVLAMMAGSFTPPPDWWARIRRTGSRLALAALGLAAGTWWLRDYMHPLLVASVGLPVYAALIYGTGAIGTEEKDLVQRLVATAPAGRVILGWLNRGHCDQ